MAYQRLRLLGDGDCFFYCAAIQYWVAKESGVIPEIWLSGSPELGQPWYQRSFTGYAAAARRAVAEWLAAKVFGGSLTLTDLEGAWRKVRELKDLTSLGEILPNVEFGDLEEGDFKSGMPNDLRAIWAGLNADSDSLKRRVYAAFFIIWYARWAEQETIGIEAKEEKSEEKGGEKSPITWPQLGLLLDVECRPQVWARVDQKYQLNGFAIRALSELEGWKLNLFVVNENDGWEGYDYEESLQYVLNTIGPDHFDPLIWFPDRVEEEGEFLYGFNPTFQGWESATGTAPIETFASRHTESTMRNPFMLGLAVWNVNHLGLPKTQGLSKWELPGLAVPDWMKPASATGRRSTRKDVKYSELDVEEESEGSDEFEVEEKKPEKKDKEKEGSSKFQVDPDLDEDSSGEYQNDEDEEDDEDAEKAPLKLAAIDQIVKLNLDWLDVLALNEVNMGVSRIKSGELYTVYKGPKMISVGPQSNSGQKEYYPLLITNRKRDFKIEYAGCFAVDPSGNETSNDPYYWIKPANLAERTNPTEAPKKKQRRRSSKKKSTKEADAKKPTKKNADPDPGPLDKLPSYRPVVVHRLKIDGKFYVNVGIVHTTPGGTEFERACVYQQLDQFFQKAHTGAYDKVKTQDHWLICGDFYLFAESLVFDKEGSQKQYGDAGRLAEGVHKFLVSLYEEIQRLIEIARALEQQPASPEIRKKRTQDDKLRLSLSTGLVPQPTLQIKNLEEVAEGVKKRAEQLEQKKADPGLFDLCYSIVNKTASDARVVDGARAALEKPDEKKAQPKTVDQQDEAPTERKKKTEDEQDENIAGEAYFDRNKRLSAQIVHQFRNLTGVTFEAQLENKYQLMQPIWGTNIHAKAPEIDTTNARNPRVSALRLADFVVCSLGWQSGFVGLVHHKKTGILRVDDDAVTTSQYWRLISDHFPIGGRFSTRADDLRVMHIVIEDLEGEKKQARGLLFLMQLYDILRRRYEEWVPDVYAERAYQTCMENRAYGKAFALLRSAIARFLGDAVYFDLADAMSNLTIEADTQTVEDLVIKVCEATDPNNWVAQEDIKLDDVDMTQTNKDAENLELS